MVGKTKKLIALLLAIVMITTLISPSNYSWSSAAEWAGRDSVATATSAARMRRSSGSASLAAASGVLDLAPFVENVKFSQSNGKDADSVDTEYVTDSKGNYVLDAEGNKIQATKQLNLYFDYSLTDKELKGIEEGTINGFEYKLPDSLIIPNGAVLSGKVYDSEQKEIGTYRVDPDTKKASIIIDKDKIQNYKDGDTYKQTMNGYLSFFVKFDLDKSGKDGKIDNEFNTRTGNKNLTITVNSKPSVKVEKTSGTPDVDVDNNTVTFHYELKVSSRYGTQGTISLDDVSNGPWMNGSSKAPVVDPSSIKINGSAPAAPALFTVNDNKLAGKNLPELAKGENYTITYDAVSTFSSTDNITASDYRGKVSNDVKVTTDKDTTITDSDKTETDFVFQGKDYTDLSVKKTGSASGDVEAGKVSFTYTVVIESSTGTKGGIDISDTLKSIAYGDRTIKDFKVISGDGDPVDKSGISVTVKPGNNADIDAISGTLPDLNAGGRYTITYTVEQTDIPEDTSTLIKGDNTIVVKNKNSEDKSSTSTPSYNFTGKGSAPDVDKTVVSYDQKAGTITWKVDVNKNGTSSLEGCTISDKLIKRNSDGDVEIKDDKECTFVQNGKILGSFRLPVSFVRNADGTCSLIDADNNKADVDASSTIEFRYTTIGLGQPDGVDTYINTVYVKKGSKTVEDSESVEFTSGHIDKELVSQMKSGDG